ncbi:MAG: FAD-dependent oxidoreductase [Patescibacteria group bacterium]|nr:FAD-dependent oxidoreductase [Patescibacteria group bacterium]MDE2015294.1 FAD-dependent oxidoreductase [Patescibacteria group bacterium]MDE2227099.1 FAD-dependent oxidoreductase [Patescibacteria group bacterium]
MYDLIIVGGGPGGVAAGIYAARKQIKTLLITDSFGGQSLVSADVSNWIGTKSISGYDLAKNLEEHLRAQSGTIEIIDNDLVESVKKIGDGFSVSTKKGQTYATRFLLIASGSRRKKIGVPGEKEFEGKGVYYCSICDAPLFGGKTVAVIGGGNAGLEAVIDLLPYASKIYVIVRSDALKGDPVTQEKIKVHPNVEIIYNALTQEILGNPPAGGLVTSLKYLDTTSNQNKDLKLDGVFVEVGAVPNSDFVKDIVKLNERGEIIADPRTQVTSDPGIWAIGDATDVLYKQNNISAGDAIKALLNIYEQLNKRK